MNEAGIDITARIRWSEETRRRVLPRRGGVFTEPCLLEREKLSEAILGLMKSREKELRSGQKRVVGRCAEFTKGALDVFLSGRRRALMVEEAAALQVLLSYFDPEVYGLMAQLLIVERGVEFALEALCESFNYGHYGSLADGGYVYLFDAYAAAKHLRRLEYMAMGPESVKASRTAWRWLRWALAVADDQTYASAQVVARRFRLMAHLPLRCALTFAFPTEEEWSTSCARECIANGEPHHVRPSWHINALMTGVTDKVLCSQLAHRMQEELEIEYSLTIIDHLGTDAVGVFDVLLGRGHSEVIEALLSIESIESVDALLQVFGDRRLRRRVVQHFHSIPELALFTLASKATDTTNVRSAEARLGAAAVVRAQRSAPERILRYVEGPGRAFLESLLQPPSEVADHDELPLVLVNPPWQSRGAAAPLPSIEGLGLLEHSESIVWEDGEREGLLREHSRRHERGPKRSATYDEELAGRILRQARKKRRSSGVSLLKLDGFHDPELAVSTWLSQSLEFWDIPRLAKGPYGHVLWALFGTRCIDGFLMMFKKDPTFVIEKLSRADSARVAPAMAEGFSRLKKSRRTAKAWMVRFPRTAAIGLVPDAVGSDRKRRVAARSALSFLIGEGHGKVVRAVARAYGRQVKNSIAPLFIQDPLSDFPHKIPRAPEFWEPRVIPRPRLLNGKVLSDEAMTHIATMLAFTPFDRPYLGIEHVRECCDGSSLEEFSWTLFSLWNAVGTPPRTIWALHALGHFGGDEVARRLLPFIHDWPGQSAHQRAVEGLRVLEAIGTEVALHSLQDVAQRSRYKALKARAKEVIEGIAHNKGLTTAQLLGAA